MNLRPLACAALVISAAAPALAQTGGDLAMLCNTRSPCAVVETKPAGKDAEGRALTVIELNVGADNGEGFKCRPYRREFWVRVEGVAQPRRVLELCNDGYGAAGVGEDEVVVGDNRIEHQQNGGSAWRWDVTYVIQLSPLRVLNEAHCSYHNVAPGFSTTRWDWRGFTGEARWTPKRCTPANGKADEDEEMGCMPEKATRRYMPIPMLEGAFERAGKRLHLGSCAAAIDESGQRGHLLAGTGRANGAELRALLLSKRDLVVTVSDRRFAAGAASWLNDDHIELWLGDYHADLSCPGTRSNLRQWGIGLDGKVHAAHGNPRTGPRLVQRLERSAGGRAQVTLHLLLPEDAAGITLAYSKAENGKQARLVATSAIKRTDATTIGGTWRVGPKAVHCAERDGQLDLIETGLPALLGER